MSREALPVQGQGHEEFNPDTFDDNQLNLHPNLDMSLHMPSQDLHFAETLAGMTFTAC